MSTMKTKLGAMVAAAVWAGAAISSAAPADALAYGWNEGPFATCSPTYDVAGYDACGYTFSYNQTIRFVQSSCSAGGCSVESSITFVEFPYPTGRKATDFIQDCGAEVIYALSSCSC